MGYAIVRTDNMPGTDVRAYLFSAKYMGADGETPAAIENGNVIKRGALMEDEREIYVGTDVTSSDVLSDVVLVATPETMYDERKKNLDDFINEVGKPVRAYALVRGGIFSVTKEALIGEEKPKKGDIVELADGTKMNVVTSASGATVVGSIIDVETIGRYTYYVIEIK